MGAIVRKDEVDRLDFGEGEWIEIKRRFTYRDVKVITAAGTDSVTMVRQVITAWNLVGEDGKVADINLDMIESLDMVVLSYLAEEITKRVPFVKKGT